MNVFEDLIVELKEANLLEKTVMDVGSQPGDTDVELYETAVAEGLETAEPQTEPEAQNTPEQISFADDYLKTMELAEEQIDELEVIHTPDRIAFPVPKKPAHDRQFFQKRAVDEVASLQVVEHVLTGVEREHLKTVPKAYDDLNAKKALHAFVQVSENVNSEEHAQVEFLLMQETESWCLALAERDRNISVAHIRRYCENSRPALSSQAMLALARFYRNLPYSESVRGKFDFVMTRLFSKSADGERRRLLFGRDEMLEHLTKLYSDWSSIPLYAADDDDSNILLTALSFEELAVEAESAETFDELIKSDFFGRQRLFKESISELFFAPIVTVGAIECNIRIGNVYVDLIDRERQKSDVASIESKYGDLYDQTISDAAGRTLDLVDLLRAVPVRSVPVQVEMEPERIEYVKTPEPVVVEPPRKIAAEPASFVRRMFTNAFSVNKWLLIVAIALAAMSVVYVWADLIARPLGRRRPG